MYRGYVKLWRKTEDSLVWRMPPLYKQIWAWLLMRANHKGRLIPMGKFGTVIVEPGQVLTSIGKIAEANYWYERHVKKQPNKKTIYRIIQWFAQQRMIVIEKSCLTVNSRKAHEKRPKSNAPFTLISIVNWHIYQGVLGDESNDESNAKVTPEGHKQECKRMIKNICGTLESLEGLLTSLPEFCDLPKDSQRLIAAFLDKARQSNKTRRIASKRVQGVLTDLIAISGETSIDCLNRALEITIEKAEVGQFTFGKHNVTGYVKAIARSRFRQIQKEMDSKYEPVETDTEALYQ